MRNGRGRLGLYVHIPFCLKKCLYCDFCSFPGSGIERMDAYTDELCRRLSALSGQCDTYTVDTLYFGGGTPTLLTLSCFERLMRALRAHYRFTDDCEITCECNPATADLAYLRALRTLGVNRLSIGLQSADDRELALLGRAHSVADFQSLFADARTAGFDNISADLMYGIPEQTLDSFCRSLTFLAELAPEHISAYGLKIEESTPFASMRHTLPLPDEDTEVAMYRVCGELLRAYGYKKYEISNFAKPGKESRHNLRYWLGEEYLGFGVAAHSFFGGERFGNSRELSAFLRGEDITAERSRLTDWDRLDEYLMLRLRLTAGIEEADFEARFGQSLLDYYPPLSELIRHGLMQRKEGRISFTDSGFFVSNTILSELIGNRDG